MRMQVGAMLAFVLLLGVAFPVCALHVDQPPSLPSIQYPTYSSWYARENLTLTARYFEQGGSQQLNWTWSWGDGTYTKTTGTAANGTSTATHAWSAAANYTVGVSVSDGFNSPIAGMPIYVNVTLDSVPPVTRISPTGLRGNGLWYIGPIQVTLSATDVGSGVASTSYRLDGGPWQTYAAPFQVQAQGNHTVDYRSVDRTGNVEAAHTVPLSIDSLPPALAIQTPVNGSVVAADSVDVHWTVSDSGSGVALVLLSVDGGIFSPVSGSPLTLQGLADGNHRISFRAIDMAGNLETASVSFTARRGIFGVDALLLGVIGLAATLAAAAVAVLLWMRGRTRWPLGRPPPTPPQR